MSSHLLDYVSVIDNFDDHFKEEKIWDLSGTILGKLISYDRRDKKSLTFMNPKTWLESRVEPINADTVLKLIQIEHNNDNNTYIQNIPNTIFNKVFKPTDEQKTKGGKRKSRSSGKRKSRSSRNRKTRSAKR